MSEKKTPFREAQYDALYRQAIENGVCHRPKGTVPGPVRICGAKGKVKCADCGAPMCARKSHSDYCYVCHQLKPKTIAIVKKPYEVARV